MAEARRLIDARWAAGLDEAERHAADMTVDLDAEQTTCPACMTSFDPRTASERCPECGLAFA